MTAVEHRRVGSVLDLQRRPVDVLPNEEYREIGVRSFARGIFLKPTVTGSGLGGKRVFHVAPGDLVVSNIFAWEGAVAIAGAECEGTIGSHRFMTWASKGGVDAAYVAHYLASDWGLEQLRRASPGSAGRNRTLSIKNFEAVTIPVPSLPDQRRISAHLDSVALGAKRILQKSAHHPVAAAEGAISSALDGISCVTRLGELLQVNPRPERVPPGEEVAFVPMAAVSDRYGAVVAPQARQRSDLTSGYKQFVSGDLIFARITPCMQNGKAAIYSSAERRVAYGSTEFHVLRGEREIVDWVHAVVRSQWFIRRAIDSFTGTAGQQRVPAIFLDEFPMPMPSNLRVATRAIRSLVGVSATARQHVERREALTRALLPAARNEVFSSLR